jgi:hypothetical protein
MFLLRMPESGMPCSLIGSRLPESSIHQAKDDLKEKEVPGGLQFESSLDSPKSCIGGNVHRRRWAGRCGRGKEAQIGSPGRNPDEEEWFMKTKIIGLLGLASLILAFAFIASAPAAPHNASALPAAATTATPAEQHPEIHDALAALRNARGHLEQAAHDFGGHRAQALKATDEAIHQLEICLKYDK